MKLIVTGQGEHGKDKFCEMLRMKFISSSKACLNEVIWPLWGKDYYNTKEECFIDRRVEREIWYNLITAYNTPDCTRLARKIFEDNDIYCGMRRKEELDACALEGVHDLSIWIDASERKPPEDIKSCTVTKEQCDIIVYNNGSLEDLQREADRILEILASYKINK